MGGSGGIAARGPVPLSIGDAGGRVGGLVRAAIGIGGGWVGLPARGGGGGGVDGAVFTGATGTGTAVSLASMIAVSRARLASEPGGGGGRVFCFLRGVGASLGEAVEVAGGAAFKVTGGAAGVDFATGGAGSGSDSTVQPDARSAIRPFVASERRRRVRSSSGTCQR